MNDLNRPHPTDEDAVRRLLDGAVSDVEPRDALATIRSRTQEESPMTTRRPWLLGAAAAVVATAATITAVAVTGNSGGTTDDSPRVAGSPTATAPATGSTDSAPEPTASEPAAAEQTATVAVYYVGEAPQGPRLFREFRKVTFEGEAAAAAVSTAVGEPALDPDYSSPWSVTDASAERVEHVDGRITVNLKTLEDVSERPDGVSEAEASLAVEQVLYTAQAALQSRDPVRILVNGQVTDTVFGVPTSEDLTQGDPLEVQALVWVTDPGEGATVSAPFEVTGVANAFEATVQWELLRDGQVVEQGFTTAAEAFTFAPYSFTVRDVPPGEYTLVVHDTDASGGEEGFGPTQDTKNITVE
jgi:hypothetical protein